MSYKKMHGVVALSTVPAVAHELLRAATAALPNIKFIHYYYCHFNIIYLFILFKRARIYTNILLVLTDSKPSQPSRELDAGGIARAF